MLTTTTSRRRYPAAKGIMWLGSSTAWPVGPTTFELTFNVCACACTLGARTNRRPSQQTDRRGTVDWRGAAVPHSSAHARRARGLSTAQVEDPAFARLSLPYAADNAVSNVTLNGSAVPFGNGRQVLLPLHVTTLRALLTHLPVGAHAPPSSCASPWVLMPLPPHARPRGCSCPSLPPWPRRRHRASTSLAAPRPSPPRAGSTFCTGPTRCA